MRSAGQKTCQVAVSLLNVYALLPKPRLTSVLAKILSPKQRLLCAPVVRGYCLAFKTWGKSSMQKDPSLFAKLNICPPAEFYVENVCPIRWSENAFPRLVLPHGYKDIIRAFVQEQLSRDDEFDDIVDGKGGTDDLIDHSGARAKLLMVQAQVWASSCC